MSETFVCHDIEWFAGDQCLICQGVIIERWRIIDLLENERSQCEKAGLFANDPDLRKDLQTLFIGLEAAIALIKGDSQTRTETGTEMTEGKNK